MQFLNRIKTFLEISVKNVPTLIIMTWNIVTQFKGYFHKNTQMRFSIIVVDKIYKKWLPFAPKLLQTHIHTQEKVSDLEKHEWVKTFQLRIKKKKS